MAKTLASKAAGWGRMAVQSLVIKLNSHMPRNQKAKTSKKKKKKKEREREREAIS